MKRKRWLICEGIFTLATGIVIAYAAMNRQDAFLIFTSYVLVVAVLSVALTVYWQSSSARAMEANRRRIAYFIDNINTPALLWDNTLEYIRINDSLRQVLGFAEGETLTQEQFPALFERQDWKEQDIQDILRSRNAEFVIHTRSGQAVTMVWSTSGMQQTENTCLFMTIGVNVTETRQMQSEIEMFSNQLAASEWRYSLSMELSEIGILLTQGDKYFISPELQRMLGLDEASVSFAAFRRLVHPNDTVIYDTFLRSVERLSQMQEDPEDQIHSMELRLRSADGEYHWYNYRYKAAKLVGADTPIIGGSFINMDTEKEKDALIERLAYVDEVTGISNRNKLMLMGQETYACSLELGITYFVMVLDIDRFHLVNDAYGYECGNKTLQDFAHIMYKYLSFGGFGARISADNFALILRDYGDEELPVKTMERIQADLAQLGMTELSAKALTCSAGYSRMPQDGESFAEVLEHAEFALSSAEHRKGTVVGYNSSMHDTIVGESELEKQLSDAIDNGELRLYYQPKIALTNGRIIGVEALIRWIRPDGTVVQPGSFVPIAETSQLIRKISDYVLSEACEQNRIWQRMGLPNIIMSINLTSADFYQTNVCEAVYEALARTGLEAQWLEIELTESLALKDLDMALEQMHQLRAMGVRLAMDDFGTGYSSLSYLQVLPITLLKLDRSFVVNLEQDEIAREIVAAVIRIAKSKHIETIAEGIEHPEQARLLRIAGCDNAQGYLYGKPMPPKEIEEFMRRNVTERQVY